MKITFLGFTAMISLLLCCSQSKQKNDSHVSGPVPDTTDRSGQPQAHKTYKLPGFIRINDTFFIAETETSIADYSLFLNHILQTDKDPDKLEKSLPIPNSIGWTRWSSYLKKKISYEGKLFEKKDTSIEYNTGLDEYPVVNIDRNQANEYCAFKTSDYQSFYKKLDSKQKDSFPENTVFRLPTSKEWMKIANTPLERPFVVCKETISAENQAQSMPYPVREGCLNSYAIYNMLGNITELVTDNDNVYGGSFKEKLVDCNSTSSRSFKKGDDCTGFRIVAIVK